MTKSVSSGMQETPISYQHEILRKLFHFSAILIPLTYYVVEQNYMLAFLMPFTALVIALDFSRHYSKFISNLAVAVFGRMIRESEMNPEFKKLSSLSFTLLSACVCIFIFPKLIAITALSVTAVSDSVAALVGRKLGKRKFFDKTLEGTLGFIISGVLVVAVIAGLGKQDILFMITGFVAVCIASVIEASAKLLHIDDNFAVPVMIGFYMGVLL